LPQENEQHPTHTRATASTLQLQDYVPHHHPLYPNKGNTIARKHLQHPGSSHSSQIKTEDSTTKNHKKNEYMNTFHLSPQSVFFCFLSSKQMTEDPLLR
jgi:hypothetical protein